MYLITRWFGRDDRCNSRFVLIKRFLTKRRLSDIRFLETLPLAVWRYFLPARASITATALLLRFFHSEVAIRRLVFCSGDDLL